MLPDSVIQVSSMHGLLDGAGQGVVSIVNLLHIHLCMSTNHHASPVAKALDMWTPETSRVMMAQVHDKDQIRGLFLFLLSAKNGDRMPSRLKSECLEEFQRAYNVYNRASGMVLTDEGKIPWGSGAAVPTGWFVLSTVDANTGYGEIRFIRDNATAVFASDMRSSRWEFQTNWLIDQAVYT